MNRIAVIGAGLAGCECSWILAQVYNLPVTLFEMKSIKPTPAQVSPHLFAELVCSNSLKSTSYLNPAGVLKSEMKKLGSLILDSAYKFAVPAGETLAVDREVFSSHITERIKNHPLIVVRNEVVENLDLLLQEGFDAIIVATGPLTDHALSLSLMEFTQSQSLYFYDAIAPILDGDSVDMTIAFRANRSTRTRDYDKKNPQKTDLLGLPPPIDGDEEGDYLNLPLNKEEYFSFVEKLKAGDKIPHHNFEEPRYFNGCQPIEVLAEKGDRTLSFGPMKPKGLLNPLTGKMPYAVVQLRKESLGDNAWNMVGFQTRLSWTAQREILKTLPGLSQVEFFRMGSMHRNTYLVSPSVLSQDFSLKVNPKLYLAGQVMGVEGYLESAAMGLFLGHVIGCKFAQNRELSIPPADTSLGALAHYCLFAEAKHFSPMNIHWGLFSELSETDWIHYSNGSVQAKPRKPDKSLKRELLACRASELFDKWYQESF